MVIILTIDNQNHFSKLDQSLLFKIFFKSGQIPELLNVCKLFNNVVNANTELLYRELVQEFGGHSLCHVLKTIQLDKKSYPLKIDGLFYAAWQHGSKSNISRKTLDYNLGDLKSYLKPLMLGESRLKLWGALFRCAHPELKVLMLKISLGQDLLENSELIRRFFQNHVSEIQKIITLNLNSLQLKLLPPEIALFLQLKNLDISNNCLSELPDEIGDLKELSELRMSHNLLQSLPHSIRNFQCLKNFQCSSNRLTTFPDEICQIHELKILNLSGNQIDHLPHQIGELKSLNYLYLESNQLTSLPASLTTMPYLIGLYLFNNQISELPESIDQMGNLKYLSVQNNALNALPERIGGILSLQSLFVDGNAIQKLPQTLCRLKNLKYFSISHNRLATLPEGMENLIKLNFFDYSSNPLQGFPDGIQNLPFWSINPDFFPHLNAGGEQVFLNNSLRDEQFASIYWRLGSKKWKEGIDSKDHVHGHDVYDLGLHGKYSEPGFLSGIERAFQFLGSRSHRRIDIEFYLALHRAACSHFKGKETSTLMGQEKVGVFRDIDDLIGATFSELNFSFSQSAITEFNDLNGELTLHFGSSFRIGDLILKSNTTPKVFSIYYHPLSKEQVAIVFNYFLTCFYYDIGHAQNDESKIKAIAKLIQRIEWLHPVRDGCGRTDTALLNYLLTVYGFTPVILEYPYVTSCKGNNELVPLLMEGMQRWQNESSTDV